MGLAPTRRDAAVVDLLPFILVADVERSIPFYEALGFDVIKRYKPTDRLEFAPRGDVLSQDHARAGRGQGRDQ
jgi:catechol 2,3-dioxygenase-like lactoylglutathione lyase family enzyme